MDMDKIVCNCLGITNGQIKDAVKNGARTLEEVQDATGAGTICGVCMEDVQHLVDEFISEYK
jgi:bacterioferritin-associated ferredoxin